MTLTTVGVLLWPCLVGPCIWRWAEAYRRRYAAEWAEPFTPRRGLTRAEWCFGFLAALSLLPGLAAGQQAHRHIGIVRTESACRAL